MKTLVVTAVMTLIASSAFSQTPDALSSPNQSATAEASLATPTGHEMSAGLASYTYNEPGAQAISIHGARFIGDYTGTLSLNKQQHWFAQGDVRGTVGNVTYNGWCSPFLITPTSESPNGYELDTGDSSPCNESGDKDWYVETRGLVGKDLIGQRWGWSPYSGLGLRHLSNGTTGTPGYRTDDYLYLPVGITARSNIRSFGALSFNVEYDHLLHGWQKTRDSALGGGDVPATPIAPAFTIDGFTDFSFKQDRGWGLRASAKYQMARRWSVEPGYIHWNVSASNVDYSTATFTVNGITARQQLGAYEPDNATNEYFVNLGFHF